MEYEIHRNKYFSSSSKPHKCPVCDGEGKKQISNPLENGAIRVQVLCDALGRYFIQCASCSGKGILWK